MTSLLDILQREDEAVKNLKEARKEVIHITSLTRMKIGTESSFNRMKEEAVDKSRRAAAEYLLVRQELRHYFAELDADEDEAYL